MSEPSPPLLLDLFPAEYEHAGAVLRSVRVFASADTLWVWAAGGAPYLAAEHQYTQRRRDSRSWEFTLPDGDVALVRETGGCGCGSTLRRWTGPWAPMRYGT